NCGGDGLLCVSVPFSWMGFVIGSSPQFVQCGCANLNMPLSSRDGGTGRRSGLKIRRPSGHGGSTPPPGTNLLPTGTVEQPHRDTRLTGFSDTRGAPLSRTPRGRSRRDDRSCCFLAATYRRERSEDLSLFRGSR